MTESAPKPYTIELVEHDPSWSKIATREAERLHEALGPILVTVHHIGSTAIPGIRAKPIVDLIPVVTSLEDVDRRKEAVEALGYQWWGDQGIEGRRYCILTDSHTGRRVAQLHIYAVGSEKITAHLALREYLRAHPEEARAYEAEKIRAQARESQDVNAYNALKATWLRGCILRAERWYPDHGKDT